MGTEYSKEVVAHLDRCALSVAVRARDAFTQDVLCEYESCEIQSPIEQLFYSAFKTILELNYIPTHDCFVIDGRDRVFGMLIQPQFSIQTYRVDFYIRWFGYNPNGTPEPKSVIVECDSQQWHERTEQERRYEKRRDRDLARLGLHTFRFTGKEIKDEPFQPAAEVCSYLTDYSTETLLASVQPFMQEV